ncbi:unnamed protein product, partial [Amoebophrya sp. A120]|eukprot:GSA120T00015601001.1
MCLESWRKEIISHPGSELLYQSWFENWNYEMHKFFVFMTRCSASERSSFPCVVGTTSVTTRSTSCRWTRCNNKARTSVEIMPARTAWDVACDHEIWLAGKKRQAEAEWQANVLQQNVKKFRPRSAGPRVPTSSGGQIHLGKKANKADPSGGAVQPAQQGNEQVRLPPFNPSPEKLART